MSYTSIGFLLFIAVLTGIFYIPGLKKHRWIVLLAGSIFFYCYASFRYIAYLLCSVISAYLSTAAMRSISAKRKAVYDANKDSWKKAERKEYKQKTDRMRKWICTVTLILNFGILAFFKYWDFTVESLSALLKIPSLSTGTMRLVLPLGISFYTFQIMGYVIDVYREAVEPERNIARLALFTMFFPQIIQGPIGTWSALSDQLFAPHDFCYEEFRDGLELILWGLLKKLVIADRAAAVIAAVRSGWASCDGAILALTVLLYDLQLYTDFSGGIDISRGVAALFGIDLAENFRRPYFASSVSDFWRRWHITLGAWLKTYLFYPLALSAPSLRFTERYKEKPGTEFGKHTVRVLPSCAATFVVFIIVGIWHGAGTQYLAFGVYNGLLISASMLLEPVFAWQNGKLGVAADSRALKLFRIMRTFILVSIGNITDLTGSFTEAAGWFGRIVTNNHVSAFRELKTSFPLSGHDAAVLLLGAALLFAVSLYQENRGAKTVRQSINRLPAALRWVVLLAGITVVLVFGIYGPGYDSASFIYMQF